MPTYGFDPGWTQGLGPLPKESADPATGLVGLPILQNYLAYGRVLEAQKRRKQADQDEASFRADREALGPTPTLEGLLPVWQRYLDPKTGATIGQAHLDRRATIEATKESTKARMQQAEQNATMLHEYRLGQAASATERAAEIKRHNQAMEAIQKQNADAKTSPQDNAAYNAGLREVAKDDKDIANTSQLEGAIKRWQELQSQVATGRVAGERPAVGQPLYQQLIQLESFLAVNNFKPGQGQISNFERQLIKGAGPTVRNDPEANMDITNVMLGGVQNARDRASFREWYLEKNRKLLGADKQWNEYVEKNPRFTKDKGGRVVPNTERQDWMTYFSAASGAPKASGAAGIPQGVDPRVWGAMTPQERALWQK